MIASKVSLLASVNRIDGSDELGGGSIVRTLYCEPYTAYPTVETALKGTLLQGDPVWTRVRPHNDPIKSRYYCMDCKSVPFRPETVTGMAPSNFDPTADDGDATHNGQLTECQRALNNKDDFNYSNFVDFGANPPIAPAAIATGGTTWANNDVPPGRCGAFITATYRPLIFQPGIVDGYGSGGFTQGTSIDAFDYVDPVWTPETVATQTGRSLFLRGGSALNNVPFAVKTDENFGGLSDTFSKPETIWHLTFRRLMVPFLPKIAFGLLQEKVNAVAVTIGNLTFPIGTLCFEMATNNLRLGPDGTIWYEITLNFKVRLLWDNYYKADGSFSWDKGWIDWNHQFGIPSVRLTGWQWGSAGYYPVVWNSSVAQGFYGGAGFGWLVGTADQHPLYIADSDMTAQAGLVAGGAFAGDISKDPFLMGFQNGQ